MSKARQPGSGLREHAAEGAGTVVLVHGLWMHGLVFLPHQAWLEKAGFAVRRFSYPSWSEGLEGNAARLSRFIAPIPGERIHLVCHSLGGLVALAMLEKHPDPRVRRAVLMGSPYAGCHCGRYLAARRPLSPLLGRCLRDWLERPRPAAAKAVDVGVIAGSRPFGLGRIIPGLPRPNDGVVAVEETRVPEARDHIVLPVSHSGMLISPLCARQAACFLRTGRFRHG